jgi:hypothetical protein
MSDPIPEAFRQTFASSFRTVVQQSVSLLSGTVRVERGLTGTGKQIEFVNPTSSEETTGQRFKKTVIKELDTDQRWYYPREFDCVTGVSKWDENNLAPTIMPNGTQIAAHRAAFNLDCDSLIINALTGVARTGTNGETSTVLPESQIIPVDYVYSGSDADSGLTVPKLLAALQILKENHAWDKEARMRGEKLWCVIDSQEEIRLRQMANAASGDRMFSRDFDPPMYDGSGTLVSWMGISFEIYEGLVTDTVVGAAGTDTVAAKHIPLYTSSALEFGVWSDFTNTVDRRPDLSNAVQFLSQYRIGAGREQEKKVVAIMATV